jgi:branched-chain amino acid aminotransferase
MQAWLWTHSSFQPASHLPLSDRGFRYGMSLFESFRVVSGMPWFWPRHAAILRASLAARGFPIDDALLHATAPFLQQHGLDGFGRLCITAGDGTLASPIENPRALLTLETRPEHPVANFALEIHPEPYAPPFGGLKTGNYWFNADALSQAHRNGSDEALLLNARGELVSACCANVFLVHRSTLSTPPRASGAREGAVRGWLIENAPVEIRPLTAFDLSTADEIFITNGWLGIQPVSRCGQRKNLVSETAQHWHSKAIAAATRN